MRGVTLIETIVYIALLSIIMSAALLSTYAIAESGTQTSDRVETENEGQFVIRKLDWALGSIASVSAPSGYGSALSMKRNGGTQVEVRLTGGHIEMREGGTGAYVPLTTDAVSVSSLSFHALPSGAGVEASTTIDGETFETVRYTLK